MGLGGRVVIDDALERRRFEGGANRGTQPMSVPVEADHAAIARSDRVLTLIAGGGIIGVGMLIGAVLPRGRSDKSRRLRF